MDNLRLGISIALMAAALIVGGTLAYNPVNATTVTGKNGGIAGDGANGGFHNNATQQGTNLNGAPGTDANGAVDNSR